MKSLKADDYEILSARNKVDLSELVVQALDHGWELLGSVFIIPSECTDFESTKELAQTVIRPDGYFKKLDEDRMSAEEPTLSEDGELSTI